MVVNFNQHLNKLRMGLEKKVSEVDMTIYFGGSLLSHFAISTLQHTPVNMDKSLLASWFELSHQIEALNEDDFKSLLNKIREKFDLQSEKDLYVCLLKYIYVPASHETAWNLIELIKTNIKTYSVKYNESLLSKISNNKCYIHELNVTALSDITKFLIKKECIELSKCDKQLYILLNDAQNIIKPHKDVLKLKAEQIILINSSCNKPIGFQHWFPQSLVITNPSALSYSFKHSIAFTNIYSSIEYLTIEDVYFLNSVDVHSLFNGHFKDIKEIGFKLKMIPYSNHHVRKFKNNLDQLHYAIRSNNQKYINSTNHTKIRRIFKLSIHEWYSCNGSVWILLESFQQNYQELELLQVFQTNPLTNEYILQNIFHKRLKKLSLGISCISTHYVFRPCNDFICQGLQELIIEFKYSTKYKVLKYLLQKCKFFKNIQILTIKYHPYHDNIETSTKNRMVLNDFVRLFVDNVANLKHLRYMIGDDVVEDIKLYHTGVLLVHLKDIQLLLNSYRNNGLQDITILWNICCSKFIKDDLKMFEIGEYRYAIDYALYSHIFPYETQQKTLPTNITIKVQEYKWYNPKHILSMHHNISDWLEILALKQAKCFETVKSQFKIILD